MQSQWLRDFFKKNKNKKKLCPPRALSCQSFWHWPYSPLSVSPPQPLNPSKNVCDSVALNCAELDYKTATTLNLISPIYFFLIQVPRSLAIRQWLLSSTSSLAVQTLSLFQWNSAFLLPSSNVFIARMSSLAFNPPFRLAGSRGAFWSQWPAFLTWTAIF